MFGRVWRWEVRREEAGSEGGEPVWVLLVWVWVWV